MQVLLRIAIEIRELIFSELKMRQDDATLGDIEFAVFLVFLNIYVIVSFLCIDSFTHFDFFMSLRLSNLYFFRRACSLFPVAVVEGVSTGLKGF